MDRQTLLEQKRQRLQELKLRRLANSSHSTEIDELVERLLSPKVLVSVGTQTDEIIGLQNVNKPIDQPVEDSKGTSTDGGATLPVQLTKPKVTFDKGVQAVSVDELEERERERERIEEKERENNRQAQESLTLTEKQNDLAVTDPDVITDLVEKSLKTLNKLLVQERNEPDVFTNSIDMAVSSSTSGTMNGETNIPFQRLKWSLSQQKRPVVSVDVAISDPNLIVVAYGHPKVPLISLPSGSSDSDSPGLAVVYCGSPSVQEFILLATSTITTARFDGPHRIMAGLANGKVVVWELANRHSEMVILPLLASPILSSSSALMTGNSQSLKIKFRNHIKPITSLLQQDSSLPVVSISLDGVVNVWSTSILAAPKVSLVQLFKPNETATISTREKLAVSSALFTDFVATNNRSYKENNPYLNGIVVGCQNGELYLVGTSSSEKDHIEATTALEGDRITPLGISSLIELLQTFRDTNLTLLLSTGMDWGFKIWKVFTTKITLHTYVQTDYMIMKAVARPNSNLQFVTMGFNNAPVLEFWSLQDKLMNPVTRIPIDISDNEAPLVPTTIEFSPLGNRLYAGFSTGQVLIWNVDEELLGKYIETKKSPIDTGIRL